MQKKFVLRRDKTNGAHMGITDKVHEGWQPGSAEASDDPSNYFWNNTSYNFVEYQE